MSHIIIDGGALNIRTAGSGTITAKTTPSGCTADTTRRPAFAKYRRTTVIAGEFSPLIVFNDSTSTFYKAGLTAPSSTCTVAAGSGSSTISAAVKAYVTYRHKSGSTVLAESNPSAASNEVTISLTGVSYSGIPTTSPDSRTTHVAIYRSDDGALAQLDTEVTLGTATATSTTATLSLGVALPQTSSGALDTLVRGVPPYCMYVEPYHDRLWYGGDPTYPQRVWYSRIGEPESVRSNDANGTGGFFLDTRDGEAVTGLRKCADQLVVLTATSVYAIQGYSDGSDAAGTADLTMVKIHPRIGGFHHSAVNVGLPTGGDLLMFAGQEGVWSYNGASFRYMMSGIRSYWRDAYLADKTNYENCIAAYDPHWQTYNLLIPATSTTFYYVGHMLPMFEGTSLEPEWVFDRKARKENTIATLVNTTTGAAFELFTGGNDGYMRQENQNSTGADDDQNKVSKVRHKHYYLGGLSGGMNHGNKWRALDLYAKHESQALSVYVNAGDEGAGDAVTPQKTLTLAAAAVATMNPKGREYCPLDGVSGAGITVETDCTNGVGVELNGFGITYEPIGSNTRLKVT